MVNIVNGGVGVDEFDQVFDDFHDVRLGEHTHGRIDIQGQFLIQTVTAYAAQVVALLGEEELIDDVTGGSLIRRFGITQLFGDVVDSLDFRLSRVLLQGVVDDGIFRRIGLVLWGASTAS